MSEEADCSLPFSYKRRILLTQRTKHRSRGTEIANDNMRNERKKYIKQESTTVSLNIQVAVVLEYVARFQRLPCNLREKLEANKVIIVEQTKSGMRL